jgi:hypothetical protein
MKSAIARVLVFALLLLAAFVAGQQSSRSVAAQSRPRWEYQKVHARNIDSLNKLGEDGWEAFSIASNDFVLLRRSK